MAKRIGRLPPRDSIPYFKNHRDLWQALMNSAEVELPEEVFRSLPQTSVELIEIKPEPINIQAPSGKKPVRTAPKKRGGKGE